MHCMDTQQIVTVARYQHGCVSVNHCSARERQCCPCSLVPRPLPQLLLLTLTVVVEDWEQGYICSKSLGTQYEILLVYRKACSVARVPHNIRKSVARYTHSVHGKVRGRVGWGAAPLSPK